MQAHKQYSGVFLLLLGPAVPYPRQQHWLAKERLGTCIRILLASQPHVREYDQALQPIDTLVQGDWEDVAAKHSKHQSS